MNRRLQQFLDAENITQAQFRISLQEGTSRVLKSYRIL